MVQLGSPDEKRRGSLCRGSSGQGSAGGVSIVSVLVPFAEDLWTISGDDVRLLGIPFSTRMTIARLACGELWVHSPVALTPERRRAVDALGSVAHIVAPNRIHSLGVAPCKALYPSATVWVSPRFQDRHPHLPADRVLDGEALDAWGDDIDHVLFAGSFFLDEVVFFHRRSRTLIVTDLIQRHEPSNSRFWRILKGWAGVLGDSGGTSRDLRWSFRDRAAARRSMERILEWDFERLVISHGTCVHESAKDTVARAFAWLT
jgi:hypothetical protein